MGSRKFFVVSILIFFKSLYIIYDIVLYKDVFIQEFILYCQFVFSWWLMMLNIFSIPTDHWIDLFWLSIEILVI